MTFYFLVPHIFMGKLKCNSKLDFQSSSCKIMNFLWTEFFIMFGHYPSNFRNVTHHKQFKFSFKNTFKIHLYHLPNISNIFNILYLIFQIYRTTNHSQCFKKTNTRYASTAYQPNQIFSTFCIELLKFSTSQTNHHFF
jgi:hypothetical protein